MLSLQLSGCADEFNALVALNVTLEYGKKRWFEALGCRYGTAKRYLLNKQFADSLKLMVTYVHRQTQEDLVCIGAVEDEIRSYLARRYDTKDGGAENDQEGTGKENIVCGISIRVEDHEQKRINGIEKLPYLNLKFMVRRLGGAVLIVQGNKPGNRTEEMLFRNELSQDSVCEIAFAYQARVARV